MKATAIFLYRVLAYVLFLATIGYCVAFFGNFFVARTIDAAAIVPVNEALLVNVGLLTLFGLQHSGMARHSFKRWLKRHVDPTLERSTYVLTSCVVVLLVLLLWQPMGGVVWSVSNAILSRAITAVYFAGWALMIYATFLINHFELFGLTSPARNAERRVLKTPSLYRYIRHPIYLGWIVVLWASPIMTVAHLVFAAGMTIYTLVGIQLEERDLVAELPDYEQYRRKVPMLLPSAQKRLRHRTDAEAPRAASTPTQ